MEPVDRRPKPLATAEVATAAKEGATGGVMG